MTPVVERQLVPIYAITPHPRNPRADVGDVTELAASIRAQGIAQALVLHADAGRLTLLIGHRRLAAARLAGLDAVPADIWEGLSEEQQVEMMLVENLQRRDLGPCEEARAYAMLIEEGGLTQDQVAARIGRNQATISRRLRLLDLPPDLQAQVDAGKIPATRALRILDPPRPRPEPPQDPAITECRGLLTAAVRCIDKEDWDGAIDCTRQAFLMLGGSVVEQDATEGEPADGPAEDSYGDTGEMVPTDGPDRDDVGAAGPEGSPHETPDGADSEGASPPPGSAPADAVQTFADVVGARMRAHRPDQLAVTIHPPGGMFNLSPITCSRCGQLAQARGLDYARLKAQRHLDLDHGGSGSIHIVSDHTCELPDAEEAAEPEWSCTCGATWRLSGGRWFRWDAA